MVIIKVVLFTKKGISTEKHVSEVSECMKNKSYSPWNSYIT